MPSDSNYPIVEVEAKEIMYLALPVVKGNIMMVDYDPKYKGQI